MASASQLQSWDSALDRLLSGRRLSSTEATRVRAALDAWHGNPNALGFTQKPAVRNALDRNAKGSAPKSSQLGNIRALQSWVRLQYAKAVGSGIQTTETYVPPIERTYPNSRKAYEAFLASLSPPAVTGSARWNNARSMLAKSDYFLLRLNETIQADKARRQRNTAKAHFAAQNLIRDVGMAIGGGVPFVFEAGAQLHSDATKRAEQEYMNRFAAQGDEPYSYGLAVHYRLVWPVAIAYARSQLADSRSWVRDRAQRYLSSIGQGAQIQLASFPPVQRVPMFRAPNTPAPATPTPSPAAPLSLAFLLGLLLL